MEDEPRAAYALYERRPARAIDLLAQAPHVHVDEVGLRHEPVAPYVLQEHGAGDQLAWSTQEILEQLELARQQLQRLPLPVDRPRQEIHRQRTALKDRLLRLGRPAQERLDPSRQLHERERLGQVVVAARLEPADTFVHCAEGADDQTPASACP